MGKASAAACCVRAVCALEANLIEIRGGGGRKKSLPCVEAGYLSTPVFYHDTYSWYFGNRKRTQLWERNGDGESFIQ